MTLFRGVYPIQFDITALERSQVNTEAVNCLKELGFVEDGDWVVLTKGDYVGVLGGTNAMKIIEVGRTGY
jgi:pyruvate kinase